MLLTPLADAYPTQLTMKKIKVYIDWCDKNFAASTADDRIGGSVVATHSTYEGTLNAIRDALKFHIEGCVADGDELPTWLIAGNFECEYVLTVPAILRRAEQFTTFSAISRASGINLQQLSHYANGLKKPRAAQREKILRGLEEISRNLGQQITTDTPSTCIKQSESESPTYLDKIGSVYPATSVKDLSLPYFDIGIVAGFPIPLDNEERAQDIELLKMLCPNPESSYLIRVEGDSMIDAGIESGDIVIVDKSNRTPSESEVAVCEFNGEYTLKRFVKRNGCGWLVPANPDYPEIKVTPDDSFSIWGTVTYIIHRPRN